MNNTLLPCPFCGGSDCRTYKFTPDAIFKCWGVWCACSAKVTGFETEQDAIAAWNRRAQPENKPLTLDELGQLREAQIPVWMGRAKEWIFVASVADAPYAQVWYFNAKGFAQTVLYHHEKFYRSKPKEEHHENY